MLNCNGIGIVSIRPFCNIDPCTIPSHRNRVSIHRFHALYFVLIVVVANWIRSNSFSNTHSLCFRCIQVDDLNHLILNSLNHWIRIGLISIRCLHGKSGNLRRLFQCCTGYKWIRNLCAVFMIYKTSGRRGRQKILVSFLPIAKQPGEHQ